MVYFEVFNGHFRDPNGSQSWNHISYPLGHYVILFEIWNISRIRVRLMFFLIQKIQKNLIIDINYYKFGRKFEKWTFVWNICDQIDID